jgi:hypothetical protein
VLTAEQRRRYARHLLLVELGEPGQERLCAARVRLPGCAHERAADVARDYLARAGVTVAVSGGSAEATRDARPVGVPDGAAVSRLAGDPLLEGAAAELAGAFSAVEAIKAITGAGTSGALPPNLVLRQDAPEKQS